MQDKKIDIRKKNFQIVSFNLLESREKFKLSLRKEKLDNFLYSKRKIYQNTHIELEIDPKKLSISEEKFNHFNENFQEEISFIKELLVSSKIDEVKFGIYKSRRLLCNENQIYIDLMLSNEMLDQFIKILLNSNDNLIIYETLWCLIQLSSTNLNLYLNLMISTRTIETYLKLLEHDRSEIVEMTLNLIGNFVIENLEIKYEILNSNLFDLIVKMIDKENNPLGVSRNIAFILSNIVNQKKPYLSEEIIKYCQDLFLKLILIHDRNVILDSIWGLCYTADTDNENITRNLYDTGIIDKLLALDFNELYEFKIPIIRIIGNIVSLDNSITEDLIKLGVIDKIEVMLYDKNKQVIREATWVISNLTAGTKSHISSVINNNNVFNKLMLLTRDNDFSIKMEAINALSFACSGSDFNLCLILINMKILELFIDLLATNTEPKLILTLIEGLENIFENGDITNQSDNPFVKKFNELDGVNQINRLQKFRNEVIYTSSQRILEKYFINLIDHD